MMGRPFTTISMISMAVVMTMAITLAFNPAHANTLADKVKWVVDSSLDKLLDATLTVPADIKDARLAPADTYAAHKLNPPPFLPSLLIEHVVRENYIAISSQAPIGMAKFDILLLLDGHPYRLPVHLKKAIEPQRQPKKPPTPQRILEWLLNKLAIDYGMERATAWLELQRISTGALHDGSEHRLILRLSEQQWPADMLTGLTQLAQNNGLSANFKQFNLLNETKLLRHLLNAGSVNMADLRDMPEVSRHIRSLEERLDKTQRQLEEERDAQRELAKMWWLQKHAWWFLAGILLFFTILLAFTRLGR